MAEIRYEVQMIRVDMVCDWCGDGFMRPTTTVLKEYPPKYVHECDKCGKIGVFDERYPYTIDKFSNERADTR